MSKDNKCVHKMCPFMMMRQVPYDVDFVRCVGKDCMWYGDCQKKQLIEIEPIKIMADMRGSDNE